jgi:hypothetical protein
VAPEGRPAVEKETAWGDPELRVAVMVLAMDCPGVTDLLPSLLREKSNVDVGEFTVKVKLVVLVSPPLVPVTMMV